MLSLLSKSFSQDTLNFSREEEIKQILKKHDEQQEQINRSVIEFKEKQNSKTRNTKGSSDYNLKEKHPRNNKNYNFNISDALGGVRLSDDPTVQKAIAAKEKRESQNTLSSTSTTLPTVEFGTFEKVDDSPTSDASPWVGILLILIGLVIWRLWTKEYYKAKNDIVQNRKIFDSPLGCVPWIITFSLIAFGLYLLFNS